MAFVRLAVVLIAATTVAVVPHCHFCAALALATTITVDLPTAVATIFCCCCRIALVSPHLSCYRLHSCRHSIAPNLASVVVPALPLPWPLLPSLLPPLMPRNPRPCCCCQCHNTLLLPPRCPRSSCRCSPTCPPLPLPFCPCLPSPSCPCPHAPIWPLPVSPLPRVAANDDNRYRCRQQSPSILPHS